MITLATLVVFTGLMAIGSVRAQPAAGDESATESSSGSQQSEELHTAFPGVRIDTRQGFVEIDASVAIDAHIEETPHIYLELVACSPDSREHESLLVIEAKPSHIHAALLLLGLDAGAPGQWRAVGETVERVPPTGSVVIVELVTLAEDGSETLAKPHEWIEHVETGNEMEPMEWVFAGSRFVSVRGRSDRGEVVEYYDADRSGTILGLATFSSEVVAPTRVISDLAGVDDPVWIARREIVPVRGTAVLVRISAAEENAGKSETEEVDAAN
ncbi:MAG: YdjY domain-containing protein [Planctomycetota bacterium]